MLSITLYRIDEYPDHPLLVQASVEYLGHKYQRPKFQPALSNNNMSHSQLKASYNMFI